MFRLKGESIVAEGNALGFPCESAPFPVGELQAAPCFGVPLQGTLPFFAPYRGRCPRLLWIRPSACFPGGRDFKSGYFPLPRSLLKNEKYRVLFFNRLLAEGPAHDDAGIAAVPVEIIREPVVDDDAAKVMRRGGVHEV